jgi:hypothetical protein
MRYIEQRAVRAWANGCSPQRYRTRADRYANVTWVLVIAALMVGYFAGWGWALISWGLAAATFAQSIAATRIAGRLQEIYETTGRKPQE